VFNGGRQRLSEQYERNGGDSGKRSLERNETAAHR
jgi:hypothetical protein